MGKAQAYLAKSEHDRVIESADAAIRLFPGNAIAYSVRANAHAEKKEYGRAIEDLEQKKIDPHCFAGYMERSAIYARLGDGERAKEDLDRAVALDSVVHVSSLRFGLLTCSQTAPLSALARLARKDRAQCLCERARVYARKGEFDRAMIERDLAMRFDPNLVNARNLTGRAFLHTKLGEYDKAMRDLGEALTIDPRHTMALNNRCWLRIIVGELEAALADCEESLSINPDAPHTLDSRSALYLKKGAVDNALADFNAALRIDPKFAHALYGRGIAKALKGDGAGGEADLAAAVAINPNVVDDYARYGITK
jgi:tetratricopeptide (TPR) repeat protein